MQVLTTLADNLDTSRSSDLTAVSLVPSRLLSNQISFVSFFGFPIVLLQCRSPVQFSDTAVYCFPATELI